MVTLFLIVLIIGLLILVHEWGHFYAARRFGIRVDEFGIGFPPRLFSRMRNGVRYSLNLLPFGGFVKIFGEHGEGEGEGESFISRPAWQRLVVLAAGVFMNFGLAWLFFSIGAAVGVPQVVEKPGGEAPVSIVTVLPGSPAEQGGLRFGDQILEMRAREISLRIESEEDVRNFVDAYRGEEIIVVVKRKDDIREIAATPRLSTPSGEGPLGIAMARLVIVRVPWYEAPVRGMITLGRSVALILSGLGSLLKELLIDLSVDRIAVSGPIGIFFFASDTRALGFSYFLQFVGILSVNLGVLNFLPIPALDGGRAFFLLLEKLKGRRLHPRVEQVAHTLGFVLLILLMIAVTYKDIARMW